jgi:RNA polymerase sigma-70 factor (ECF subfamily)
MAPGFPHALRHGPWCRGLRYLRGMGRAVDAWFVREVLVHEQALMRFLRRNWRDQDEVPDLRQEVYVRVYESATRRVPDSPKSFLFATARNLLVDRVRHQRIVPITAVGDIEQLHVMEDELEPSRWLGGREALARLARALDRLPDRCREVVWLRRIEDLPQKEIARRLGISEKTVEKHIAKGSRMLAEHFHGEPDVSAAPGAARRTRAWLGKST